VVAINAIPDDTHEDVEEKKRRWEAVLASAETERARLAADAWCAAFTMTKQLGYDCATTDTVRRLRTNARLVPAALTDQVRVEATKNRFLHPQLAFPDVFEPNSGDYGWSGGFDCVIGNPPWGRVELIEERFFAARAPEIATAPNQAERKKLIARLEDDNPSLWGEYHAEQRRIETLSNFFHCSGRFPLTGVGKVNTYALFAELARQLLGPGGRSGLIVQSGIATEDTTKAFFADLVSRRSLVAIHGFENEEKLFPIHNQYKYCLLVTASPGTAPEEIELSFFNRQPKQIHDPARAFRLTASDFALINPNTLTCPVFRSSTDARIVQAAHRRFPVLVSEGGGNGNPWGVTLQTLFNMASDSDQFRTRQPLFDEGWQFEGVVARRGHHEYLPLLEGKMIDIWNARAGTYEGQTQAQANKGVLPPSPESDLCDPMYESRPRYWVDADEVRSRSSIDRPWAIGWRDIGPKERTLLSAVIPAYGAGDTLPLLHLSDDFGGLGACFQACWSSLITDYLVRQRSETGRMSLFVVKQLPTPPPQSYLDRAPWSAGKTIAEWITPRALELSYTFWNLRQFAVDQGDIGAPFRWDGGRRAVIKTELDAAFFYIFGLRREDVEHVLDSFGLVRNRDISEFGEYWTKRIILDIFDRMQNAVDSGRAFESSLEPGPGSDEIRHQDR
jgi:hypothetical protein